MGAKQIYARYVERNRAALPTDPTELRAKLLEVAEKSKLTLTENELNEVLGTARAEKPRKGAKTNATEKQADTPSEKI
jgi:hypothetical protein